MTQDIAFTLSLPADLAAALRLAATERGWTPESLIRDCVAQYLEIAVRHRALVERLELVDDALLDMARAVGELSGAAEDLDPGDLCRYRPPRSAGR